MTDTSTHLTDAVTAAKDHAQSFWRMFTTEKNLNTIVPDWRTGRTPDGSPRLSVEVVGQGAAYALRQFASDFYLPLPNAGDVRPQFDITQPGRTVLVWRYGGVWVELWHPDSVATIPAHRVPAPSVPASPAAARRSFLRSRPGGRLPFTRKRTDKETTTR